MTKELTRKLDEVVGRQERTMSLINQVGGGLVQTGHGVPPPPGGQQQQHIPTGDTIRRHEVDAMFANQNAVLNAANEIRY